MKSVAKFWPVFFLLTFFSLIFYEIIFLGLVPSASDILTGAYFPWLDFKWGFPVGVPIKNPLMSDQFAHFMVIKQLVGDLTRQGIWPLWDKYMLAGAPLLASYHTNPFFPANLLLTLPHFIGWRFFIATAPIFASLTMYLYLSHHVKSNLARLFGSVVFSISGLMGTWFEAGTAVWGMACLPLILYLIDRIYDKKTGLLPLYSLVIAILIFAGNVQVTTYSGVIIIAYLIYNLYHHRSLRLIIHLLVFSFLGISLSLVQLLPTYDLFHASIRSEERFVSSINYGLIPLLQLTRLWIADFFGHPVTGNQWGNYDYHEFSAFLGTITFPLVLSTLFGKRNRPPHLFFSVLFFLSLFLVTLHPISKFIFGQPIPLLTYSLASRLLFITTFSAAILAAFSLDTFNSRKIILFSGLLLLISGLSLSQIPDQDRVISLRNSLLPLSFLICTIFLLLIKLPRRLLFWLFLLFICFDLGRYIRKHNPVISPTIVFPKTAVIDYVQRQPGLFRVARERTNLFPPNSLVYYHFETVEGYEPLRLLNYNRLFHLLENGHYFNASYRISELEDVNPKFLDALNVKYFFIVKKDPPTHIQGKLYIHGYHEVFSDHSVAVLENPHALPRAYFVAQVKQVADEVSLAKILEDPQFDPRTSAVTTDEITQEFVPTSLSSKVEIVNHGDDQVIIQTSTDEPNFLVIADTYDPGWRATIDGQRTNIYSVNGALRGLIVPAGNHRITMLYRPTAFVLGLKLSIISFIVIVISFIYLNKKYFNIVSKLRH